MTRCTFRIVTAVGFSSGADDLHSHRLLTRFAVLGKHSLPGSVRFNKKAVGYPIKSHLSCKAVIIAPTVK